MNKTSIRIKVNFLCSAVPKPNFPTHSIPAVKIGQIIEIECDEYGTPLIKYWRRRLKDSKIDNCIEVIDQKKPIKSSKGGEK